MQNDIITAEMEQHIQAEQAVIGAILFDNEAIITVAEILLAEDYLQTRNRIIFESMLELWDNGEPIDIITLSENLNRRKQLENIGGLFYITQLYNAVPTAANVGHYAKIVLNASLERKTRKGMKQIYENSGLSAEEMAIEAQHVADRVAERTVKAKGGFKTIRDVAMQVYEKVENSYLHPHHGGLTGLSSGYADLDRITSGFQRQDLIIVGARPSVGKTAFALNIAQAAGLSSQESIAVFSLEMGAVQLVQRMISAEGNIDANRMRTGHMDGDDWEHMTMAIGRLSDAHVYIDDSPTITVHDIRSRCLKLKKETGSLGMILIDYLQLISSFGISENRQQEISKISRTLKQIARELDTTVIALSQLSRAVEQRQDKRPMMSDLRESGSIEQDADIVAFLYRDDYYDKESQKKNIIEIIIAKHRNGPLGTVELAFLKNYNKFVGLDRSHHDSQPA